ncbi:hypothetical protein TTHERM_001030019 (macronuclear) [Tetrahymena thermophila SB210]|uniref:Uncharacterized protein n=1 Tax=Tetrahymena thermophila (strain SB210) TaxID=312017 RepID=W7X5C7_TETTS|nr:hypothetical protein TTHERM_001030019 [Tetrahymena thermophila SB210]EWS74570.1 hypothetical protein TTHERM_001030019 [Tetrahymena thermophila SB210]|eukprot:XP_012652902.1 hypothetical protein TTHERM_001030019 [Tetrahymena thermophila SB210]
MVHYKFIIIKQILNLQKQNFDLNPKVLSFEPNLQIFDLNFKDNKTQKNKQIKKIHTSILQIVSYIFKRLNSLLYKHLSLFDKMCFLTKKIIVNEIISSIITNSIKSDIKNNNKNSFESLEVLPLDTDNIKQKQTKDIINQEPIEINFPIKPFLKVYAIREEVTFNTMLLIKAIIICQSNIIQPQNNIEIVRVWIVLIQKRVNLIGLEISFSERQKMLKNQ